MSDYEERLDAHYGRPDLTERILAALQAAGLVGDGPGGDAPAVDDLAPLDEFHTGGRDATLDLLDRARPAAAARILDLGCGVGGPARVLASRLPGATIVGVDIVPEYCRAARRLNELTGLDRRVEIRRQDLRDLAPVGTGFDLVWSQHALMNVPDKVPLLEAIPRLLRGGAGTFAFHEVFAGEAGAVVLPVPWAGTSADNHLVRPDAWRDALASLGFVERDWRETSSDALSWIDRSVAARRKEPSAGRSGLTQALLLGPDAALKSRNLRRNLDEGRIRIFMGVFEIGT